jgi:hypothetical protein
LRQPSAQALTPQLSCRLRLVCTRKPCAREAPEVCNVSCHGSQITMMMQ